MRISREAQVLHTQVLSKSFPNMPRTRYGAVRPLCLKDVQESLEFLGAYCEEKAAPRMMTTRRVFGGNPQLGTYLGRDGDLCFGW